MAGVVVLDAGALIALYEGNDAHHEWAIEMFTETVSDELVMSALTYAEVLVHPTRAGKAAKFEKDISRLGMTVSALSAVDATDLTTIRATTALKMPDAVVLLEASRSMAAIATTDQALARKARERGHTVFAPHNEEN